MRLKGVFVFTIFVWCSLLWAMKEEDLKLWEIVSEDQSYYLRLKNEPKKMIEIEGLAQMPSLEKVECHSENNLCLIIYYAGETGTQRMIKHWNAAIYNLKSGFFEGDYPYKYDDKERYYPQPKYNFQKNKLVISDETTGISKEINYTK